MDRLGVRKLYIDSCYRVSGGSSNFECELHETVELPENTRAFVTEFTRLNGWNTAYSSNNQLYIVEELNISSRG